ncbi:ninjurin-1-like [Cloeon dipterum]|uniref:ninjurin-1-like n=1 Tax=Cloeon dipterum TaxID=197152 RepID=UPI00322092C1
MPSFHPDELGEFNRHLDQPPNGPNYPKKEEVRMEETSDHEEMDFGGTNHLDLDDLDRKPHDKQGEGTRLKNMEETPLTYRVELNSEIAPDGLSMVETAIPRLDVNIYSQKKTLAQGMMDLALLSANANQLRYVLDRGVDDAYYYISLTLISASIILQIAVGIGLIWNGQFNIKKEKDMHLANRINNFTVIGIFLVTIINVFISAFSISTDSSIPPKSPYTLRGELNDTLLATTERL